MHSQLKIVKGVQRAPGDVYSLESDYTTLDLMRGEQEGFALQLGGWNPQVAQPKPGLWYETPFNDGRIPFAGADQNVVETMSLTLTAPDAIRLAAWMRLLGQMQNDCLRFWEDEHMQYDPVFLWWEAQGAPGAQYALIYKIEASPMAPMNEGSTIIDVTLTLEREPYWRALPPGANPVLWTLYTLGEQPGLNYTYNDGKLQLIGSGSTFTAPQRALVSANLQNRAEYQLEAGTTDIIRFSQNHVTIPAASIPGDAPALVSVAVRMDKNDSENTLSKRLMIAHRTGDVQIRNKINDDNFLFVNCLPAIQSLNASGTPATVALANDTGGVLGYTTRTTPSFTTRKRLEITPTASLVPAIAWVGDQLNAVVQRGRFACFMRCRQDSGSAGDITVSLRLDTSTGGAVATLETPVPLQAGAGNTTRYPLMYLGTLNIPNDRAAPVALGADYGGTGLSNGSNSTLTLSLLTRRSTGSAKLYIADVIFMPIDEGFVDLLPTYASPTPWFLFDDTGYVPHGKPDPVALGFNTDNDSTPIEVQGPPLYLTPQIDNHLFFLYRINDNTSGVPEDLSAFINIIPRWRYIREV